MLMILLLIQNIIDDNHKDDMRKNRPLVRPTPTFSLIILRYNRSNSDAAHQAT